MGKACTRSAGERRRAAMPNMNSLEKRKISDLTPRRSELGRVTEQVAHDALAVNVGILFLPGPGVNGRARRHRSWPACGLGCPASSLTWAAARLQNQSTCWRFFIHLVLAGFVRRGSSRTRGSQLSCMSDCVASTLAVTRRQLAGLGLHAPGSTVFQTNYLNRHVAYDMMAIHRSVKPQNIGQGFRFVRQAARSANASITAKDG